jgi:hypothetical protein
MCRVFGAVEFDAKIRPGHQWTLKAAKTPLQRRNVQSVPPLTQSCNLQKRTRRRPAECLGFLFLYSKLDLVEVLGCLKAVPVDLHDELGAVRRSCNKPKVPSKTDYSEPAHTFFADRHSPEWGADSVSLRALLMSNPGTHPLCNQVVGGHTRTVVADCHGGHIPVSQAQQGNPGD